jgi:eukaryotic-like serine/threonine-protein kinase
MAPQHWQEVKAILGEALEREDEEERTAYVEETCTDAPELRHDVETLLRVSGRKIEACAEHLRRSLLNRIWSQPVGRRLGAYRLMGEIGRGGMGRWPV